MNVNTINTISAIFFYLLLLGYSQELSVNSKNVTTTNSKPFEKSSTETSSMNISTSNAESTDSNTQKENISNTKNVELNSNKILMHPQPQSFSESTLTNSDLNKSEVLSIATKTLDPTKKLLSELGKLTLEVIDKKKETSSSLLISKTSSNNLITSTEITSTSTSTEITPTSTPNEITPTSTSTEITSTSIEITSTSTPTEITSTSTSTEITSTSTSMLNNIISEDSNSPKSANITILKNNTDSSDNKTWDKREDFKVKDMPGLKDDRLLDLDLYSGQLKLGEKENYMYFMLAKNSTNQLNSDSWVIWLNGGPGCTSMYGSFLEHGPFELHGNNTIVMRNDSWTKQVDVLYIDQPFGTGLSRSKESYFITSYSEMKDELTLFLQNFLKIFPEYLKKKLILAGESDAGVSIPYLAHSILYPENKENNLQINLKGIMIGNGWIGTRQIYSSYKPFIESRLNITDKLKDSLYNETSECLSKYGEDKSLVRLDVCDNILTVLKSGYGDEREKCLNIYNYDIYDTESECGESFPMQTKYLDAYMQSPEVLSALNVRPGIRIGKWVRCSSEVIKYIDFEKNKDSIIFLSDILKKVPVLLYVGDKDVISNTLAHEYIISNLTWNGFKGFKNYQNVKSNWEIDNRAVGIYHTERNLSFSVIFGASHMVAIEKPKEMLVLLSKFANFSLDNMSFKRSVKFNEFGIGRSKEIKNMGKQESNIIKSLVIVFIIVSIILMISANKKKIWLYLSNITQHSRPNLAPDNNYYELNTNRSFSQPVESTRTASALLEPIRELSDSSDDGFLGHYDYNASYNYDSDESHDRY
ncbi:hypothetical protein BB561_000086 [Smittium simulii]|uniref:Pheromone-processing carboxypeptidase KEX1 n=1 Tax=Smittium simulii TaxID=133385 RepID=A0A2T9Z0Q5_9FUNG|nr:hypothetical protein BB561_000086 [Smittium simulii]